MTSPVAALRQRSEEEAARLPALLARAEHLAGTVLLGEHGRRRSGLGDDFWQYRPMQHGDVLRDVDWRRSARSDTQFVREREWQIAQSVILWVDQAASMRFASDTSLGTKADRARTLAMAASILLIRGGERVGLTGFDLPPRRGQVQISRLAELLSVDQPDEYSEPEARGMLPQSRAIFLSDFLNDPAPVEAALTKAADRGVRGALVQILDPSEEDFPFDGRTIFQSIGGGMVHETLKAGDLRNRYMDRLAERKERLEHLSRLTGWQYTCHHTSESAQSALLWIYRAMDGTYG